MEKLAPARSLLPFVCHALHETVRPLMVFAEEARRTEREMGGRTRTGNDDAGLCLKNEQLLASSVSVRPFGHPPTVPSKVGSQVE